MNDAKMSAGQIASYNATALAVVGDSNDPAVFGSTPWHLVQTGKALGIIDRGLALSTTASKWVWRRRLWSLKRTVTHFEQGGYQYSDQFLSTLFSLDPPKAGECIVNMFQLYPEELVAQHDGPLWFYLDQTLTQLFDHYGIGHIIGPRIQSSAIARERAQYHTVAGIILRSRWAARSVIQDYGVPSEKVHVVLGAANLDRDSLTAHDTIHTEPPPREKTLRLVFVGKDWRRKGLDRLILGLSHAREKGADVELLTIGVAPKLLPDALRTVPGVIHAGFVDKRREPRRFIDLVAGCDVGCLLSRAEAGGLSLREFQRLGLVTIAPAVGGSPEYTVPGASHLVGPQEDTAAIGAMIHRLATEPGLVENERKVAWTARYGASWDAATQMIGRIIHPHACPAY